MAFFIVVLEYPYPILAKISKLEKTIPNQQIQYNIISIFTKSHHLTCILMTQNIVRTNY